MRSSRCLALALKAYRLFARIMGAAVENRYILPT